MMNKDKAVEHYLSLNPTLFDVLDKFEVRQERPDEDEDSPIEMVVEIWLRILLDAEEDRRRLRLIFFGVKDLKFETLGFINRLELSISSIKHYQWEGLRYEVRDEECVRRLLFYCWRFEASLVTV